MVSALTSDQVGTHPSITSELPCAHIWSCENTSHAHIRMTLSPKTEFSWYLTRQLHSKNGNSPYIWSCRNQSSHHDRMAQLLHLTMEGTNPFTMSKWLMDSSLPFGGNLDLENTKLLPEVIKLHPSQWLCQHIRYLFIHHNILELNTPLCTISLI